MMQLPSIRYRCLFVMVLGLLCLPMAGAQSALRWQPPKLTNGSPVLFQLSAPGGVESISGTWLTHNLTFSRMAGTRSWYALGGIPLQTSPGVYDLRITEKLANGRTLESAKRVKVQKGIYPKIRAKVQVAKQFTEPNQTQLAVISVDKGLKEKVFATVSGERLWSGPFTAPVSAAVSDLYGTQRVFNRVVQSTHQGLDYAAPAGTPVRAINKGIILLARPMFFEGNCIVIDHGQGLLSLYLHLSEFKAKEGDEVSSGQVIALSGGTGRATGAHLHLAIRWEGVYLNPSELLKLSIPKG